MSTKLDAFLTSTGLSGKGLSAGGSPIEWSRDQATLQAYSQDLWPRKLLELRENGPPRAPAVDLVLWPENAAEVSEVVQWAKRADVALYPYGAGSGVCGAVIPLVSEQRPRVVVDLKRMRRVRALDRKSLCVWAESGLIGENLERTLNQEGFTLGHFPSSIYCSSLGGYLATRSAGQFSTKYGKIEDLVLALEVVLPDGSVIETGRAPRSAMGPDLTQFLLGTEGTLGFFTAACLQVQPLPEERVFLSFQCGEVEGALEFARALMQGGLRPAVLRIYDPLETTLTLPPTARMAGKERISEHSESKMAGQDCPVLYRPLQARMAGKEQSGAKDRVALVVIFEGRKKLTQAEAEEATEIAFRLGVTDSGPSLAQHWWEHRYAVSYKQQLILSHNRMILDTFELAATWDKLFDVYQAVKRVPVGLGVVMAHFSHFYHTGANIYFTLVGHAGVSHTAVERYDEIWERFLEAADRSGATLSHHHGVGLQKKEWLKKEKGAFLPLFEKVKRAFDPENRLNPGKMGL